MRVTRPLRYETSTRLPSASPQVCTCGVPASDPGAAAATGSGQNLYGASGSAVDGLTVQVTGGALGDRGTVTVQRGYAAQLHTVSGNLLSSNGMVQNASDAINSSISSLGKQIDLMQKQLDAKQALYYAQFNALSKVVASMTNTSNYLATQLAMLQKQRTGG